MATECLGEKEKRKQPNCPLFDYGLKNGYVYKMEYYIPIRNKTHLHELTRKDANVTLLIEKIGNMIPYTAQKMYWQ